MDVAPLRPLVVGWNEKVKQAARHKKPFDTVAQQCKDFFSADTNFMWEDKYQQQFMHGKVSPKFKITINKAHELVAVIGPSLYWNNPQRSVQPRKQLDLHPAFFGGDEELFQQAQQEHEELDVRRKARAELVQTFQNYTPDEQPGGGLASHAKRAITEALVKGRGCLWAESFHLPGADVTLVGSFFDSVDNLFIDPDAESLDDAWWIAQKCRHPVWWVEREYGHKPGALQGAAQSESANAEGETMGDDLQNYHRQAGKTNDEIVYYKIWSRMGVGGRLAGLDSDLADRFDEVVGDFAYIVVAPGYDYPLNAPQEVFEEATEEDVARMFEWPAPYWKIDRWPVSVLDFYENMRSPWPIAPLSPALGELIFLNVMISHLANRIWNSSRDFMAVREDMEQKIKDVMESGEDLQVFAIPEVSGKIEEFINVLKMPEVNKDVWTIIERVFDLFDKRTGLSEYLYGSNPDNTQPRSAEDARNKQQNAGIRPEYMAKQVEKWMSDAAKLEKLACRWFVQPQDVVPLMGRTGAMLWENLITSQDPAEVILEIDVTVEAGSTARPNKQRDSNNMQTAMQTLLPILDQHLQMTGDPEPLNNLVEAWGETMDLDTSSFAIPERDPVPQGGTSPEEQQMQQQQMQQEMETQQQQAAMQEQQQQVDLQMKHMDVAARQADIEHQQTMAGIEQQKADQEATRDQQRFLMEIAQNNARHAQDMEHQRQQGALKVTLAKKAATAKPKPKPTKTKA